MNDDMNGQPDNQEQKNQINVIPISSVKSKEKGTAYKPWLKMIFLLFKARWGLLWTDKVKDAETYKLLKIIWHDALNEFEHEVIMQAALECSKTFEFVPSPPQFRDIAISIRRLKSQRLAEQRHRQTMLEHDVDPKTAHKNLERIRELLGTVKRIDK